MLRKLCPEIRTDRGLIEFDLNLIAGQKLKDWFGDEPGAWPQWVQYYQHPKPHASILAALGRVEDDDLFLALAQRIAEERIRTADAVRFVRTKRRLAKALERAAEQAGLGRLTWIEIVRKRNRDPEFGRVIEEAARGAGVALKAVPTEEQRGE